ncbi:MAG: MlaD family protein, partial [Geobacteraceae bacterium]|nr:MlaD family protein [Geobacteraceae bacterium]
VIAEDRSHVIVTATVSSESTWILVKDTNFWVVRPRIYGGYISGLDTLLGGTYIGVDVGSSTEQSRTFRGLEVPPVVTTDAKGTTFFRHAKDLGSLNITSPIFFRRLQVGQVVAYDLDKNGQGVTFTIFINSPYDRFVKTNSVFWHASGIDLSLTAAGLKVNTESLVAILLGGVAFETPMDGVETTSVLANTTFALFANREDALKHAESARTFRLVFRDSVQGLSVNSPVEFQGVPLGEVKDIALEFNPRRKQFYVAVEVELYLERLYGKHAYAHKRQENIRAIVDSLVERGLRAQLGSSNLLTGQRHITLDFAHAAQKTKIDWNTKPPEFPTTGTGENDLRETLTRIAGKIDKMPLEETVEEVRSSVRSLNVALNSADKLLKRVDKEIVPEARAVLDEARATLRNAGNVLSPDAPVHHDLRDTLQELSRAARSVRVLTDFLERHPESLIRGKRGDEQ